MARTKTLSAPAGAATSSVPTAPTVAHLPDEIRRSYVAQAAYYLAERRGFDGGDPVQDWLDAEEQIDKLLSHRPGRQ